MEKYLIIDDDQVFCERIESNLSGGSVTFTTANSKYEAETKIKNIKEKIDLVLLDLTLDEPLDGLQIIPIIKKYRPDIPVIIITKDDYEGETMANIMKHGVAGFLSKGKFNPSKWSKAFQNAIALSKTHILLVFDAIDMPFAGWIEAALTIQKCKVIRQCGDYKTPNWIELIQQNDYFIPILTSESVSTTWFKQMSKAVTKTGLNTKIIPIKYRPCTVNSLEYEPGRLVNFCDELDAFFVGRKRLIEKIVEINEE